MIDGFANIQLSRTVPRSNKEFRCTTFLEIDGSWGWLDRDRADILAVDFLEREVQEVAEITTKFSPNNVRNGTLEAISILVVKCSVIIFKADNFAGIFDTN